MQKLTDHELSDQIRAAVDTLNGLLGEAVGRGLNVTLVYKEALDWDLVSGCGPQYSTIDGAKPAFEAKEITRTEKL